MIPVSSMFAAARPYLVAGAQATAASVVIFGGTLTGMLLVGGAYSAANSLGDAIDKLYLPRAPWNESRRERLERRIAKYTRKLDELNGNITWRDISPEHAAAVHEPAPEAAAA